MLGENQEGRPSRQPAARRVFTVEAAGATLCSPRPMDAVMIDRSRHSVLVVDDNPSARYATARKLQAAGFNVLQASAGAQALELVEFVSAVVLDVHLPDLLGFEVCRLLRSRPSTAGLPVIYVSALYVSEMSQEHGMEVGGNAYMVAPVDPEALLATLDQLIGEGPAYLH
jgi:DNA-binding response OmpR family regulator